MGAGNEPLGVEYEERVSVLEPLTRHAHLADHDSDMAPSVSSLAEMLAVGLDLPAETFREAGKYG